MKKILRAAVFTMICALPLWLSVLTGSAAGSTVLAVSNQSPEVGETVTVTVTIQADESMYATEAYLSFDSSRLRFESGDSANLVDGRVKIVGTPGGSSDPQSYHLQFTAIAAGACPLAVADAVYVGERETAVSGVSYVLNIADEDGAAKLVWLRRQLLQAGTDLTADVNGDGFLDIRDLVWLKRKIAA